MSFIDLHTNVSLGHTKIVGLGGEKLWLCPTLGGDKLDISGNGNHGTYNGGMGTVADTSNGGVKAYSFDGSNDYISVPFILDPSQTAFSFSSWVRLDSLPSYYRTIAQQEGTLGRAWVHTNLPSQGYDLRTSLAGGADSTFNFDSSAVGTWYHVAFVWDGSTSTFFVNAVDKGGNVSGSMESSTSGMRIGYHKSDTTMGWDGLIDDVRIFDRALTTSEITHLASKRGVLGTPRNPVIKKRRIFYAPTAPVTTTAKAVVLKKPKPSYATGYARNASESANPNLWKGLVGAWMPSFGVTGGTLKDVSGNGNDGTLTNMDAATDWVGTSKGLALDLDALQQRIEGDTSYQFNSSVTICATIKWQSVSYYPRVFDFSDGLSSLQLVWDFGSGGNNRLKTKDTRWQVDAPSYQSTSFGSSPPLVGKWYTYAALFDSTNQINRLYVNSIKQSSSASGNVGSASSSQNFKLGIRRDNNNVTDADAEYLAVSIYNRALSPSEIKQLYLNPSAPFERKQQTVGISTAQAFNPYWANQATQLAGTLQ